MKKNILFILLCGILISVLFLSCGNNEENATANTGVVDTTNSDDDPDTTETERIETNLPETDFGGRTFKVLGRDHDTYAQFVNFEIDAEGMTGDLVNDAVYQRNSVLEEKYNIVIEGDLQVDPHNLLKKLIMASDNVYDLAFVGLQLAGSMSVEGNFYDFNRLNHLDFDKPWWSREINNSISINNQLFYTTSDFNLMDKNRTYILMFNKDMLEAHNLDSIYQHVYDGSWTLDKMNSLNTVVSYDIDGDGVMTDKDQWGLGMDSYNAFYIFCTSSDNYIITKDADDKPKLTVNNEHMVATIDKVLSIINNKDTSFYCEDFGGRVDYDMWAVSGNTFYDGRLLFMAAFTHSLANASAETDVEYGVLPYPKYDEVQESYVSSVDPEFASVIVIPSSSSDPDFSAFILEALSASSKYDIMPAYYEVSTKTKYIYDADSPVMLDIIFSGLQYDLAIIYDWGGIKTLFTNSLPSKGENNFTSLYASIESQVLGAIENTLNSFNFME